MGITVRLCVCVCVIKHKPSVPFKHLFHRATYVRASPVVVLTLGLCLHGVPFQNERVRAVTL